MAPRANEDYPLDPRPYAEQAGLAEGEGATVVLRVEVLDSGLLGRVEVEVSGGRASIDAAAVDFARSTPWVAGCVDGRPLTMWIRWGVRLQA
jgi:TonB family protein